MKVGFRTRLTYLIAFLLNASLSLVFSKSIAQQKYEAHQPYSSYWFIDSFLKWSPDTDSSAKFNTSKVPLEKRFTDTSTQLRPELSTEPSIVSLVASHTTSNHPSQGFNSVEQYAFPYWQYIDYFVQWGGSSGEGIIVTPAVPWIDAAHFNGVKILGTVFFPPNVYGGKEEWVRAFLQRGENGNFPVADQLLNVAAHYGFDGWFINQETNGMNEQDAADMQAFMIYYQQKAKKRFILMWYDAMIEDGRVIWQDELNHHNNIYFQQAGQKMSDIMFIDFGWSATQLEDSHERAYELGRKPWELYSGIDAQAKSYKTHVDWKSIYKEEKPYTTSIGLYWPNSTFDIAKNKQPESVYEEEQKFWNGTILEEEVPAWQSKEWKGFSRFIPARSIIDKIPFVTNFNYGLGRFYNEGGKQLSTNEWHNLSSQDILPTWQWNADTSLLDVTFDFHESYIGGSSLRTTIRKDTEKEYTQLYKTQIDLAGGEKMCIVAKGTGQLLLAIDFADGTNHRFSTPLATTWKSTTVSLNKFKGKTIVKLGVEVSGDGGDTIYVGQIGLKNKKPIKLTTPKVLLESFVEEGNAELFVHIEGDPNSLYHNIYRVESDGTKVWLGQTKSEDYYVSSVAQIKDNAETLIQVISIARDGAKSKPAESKIVW
ncbi:MAG: hypothetical protein JXR03_20055 [Cyclobacteriaceae bacterium]